MLSNWVTTNGNNNEVIPLVGAGGVVICISAFAVDAIFEWAVTNLDQYKVNLNEAGEILMVVGVVGAVLAIIVMVISNVRRRRTVSEDGRGIAIRRVDSEY